MKEDKNKESAINDKLMALSFVLIILFIFIRRRIQGLQKFCLRLLHLVWTHHQNSEL